MILTAQAAGVGHGELCGIAISAGLAGGRGHTTWVEGIHGAGGGQAGTIRGGGASETVAREGNCPREEGGGGRAGGEGSGRAGRGIMTSLKYECECGMCRNSC